MKTEDIIARALSIMTMIGLATHCVLDKLKFRKLMPKGWKWWQWK